MARDEFLTEQQEQQVVQAITEAENTTSSEIRVHIEHTCDGEPLERAKEVFADLAMSETELNNGVLLYLATDDHKIAIYGGKGIHEKVGQAFWDSTIKQMIGHFKADEFEEGMVEAVKNIGEQLAKYFPYQDGDENELSDDISYHANRDDD
ncbi:MAG: TPM domain-containing protein [Bacteroidota bacterium]